MDKSNKSSKSHTIKKIKANNDFEINGRVYFIPDKYIGNALLYLSYEHTNLYKYIIAMYLDSLIVLNKIENISKITKKHLDDSILIGEKLLSYILMGKLYITNLTTIEKMILNKVPEYLIEKINHNIIEKID